ncbi:MAG: DeoR/GlpR family DNA-binding transcription regulator [Spirochaetaceae bacterium]|jgi:DeoR/GlpR family transcriptional regulator of sugar metabolism|nr:DeoR/GlpR family DNA-binding transcription regulator [Spirochaetaceae bacterium]
MAVAKGLKIDLRRKRILEILSRDGQVWVSALAAELGTTPVTIRNDLAALGDEGYLERISGGAVKRVRGILSNGVHSRRAENREAKMRIAIAAAELIKDGQTLFINSGTTTYYTALELKRHKNLNIVTNSISVALELGDIPSFRVILLGGDINVHYSFTHGNNALEQLRQFKANKTILSMDGIHLNAGLTTYHAEEAAVNRVMMERSEETIVVADQSKLGYESFSFVADLFSVSYLVTDLEEDEDALVVELKRAGLRIITAAGALS